jgi:hypothetical protein
MSELPEPTFRKTKTEKWAVMAPVETLEAALASDGVVKVLKKSGDHSKFTVGSLGKPFDVDGVQMCYGYAPGDEDAGQANGGSRSVRSGLPAERQGPPPESSTPPPSRDESEPMPEFQGEDQWDDAF